MTYSLMDGRSGGEQFLVYLGMMAWVAMTVTCGSAALFLALLGSGFCVLFGIVAIASAAGLLAQAVQN